MNYAYDGTMYSIPDSEIDNAVKLLNCSIDEACQMYLSDRGVVIDETVEELTKNANKNKITNKIHGAKGQKKPRKPKEKKENALKKAIIQAILESLNGYFGANAEISVRNDEKYIDINYENREFTVNLVEHRTKKE